MGVKSMRSRIGETGQMTVDVLDNLGILLVYVHGPGKLSSVCIHLNIYFQSQYCSYQKNP